MRARIAPAAWIAAALLCLSTGAPAAERVINMNGIPCDLQCQVDGLQATVRELQEQVRTLQNEVKLMQGQASHPPRPVGAYCKDSHTLASTTGQTWACDPYICQGSACVKQCATVSDCVGQAACNAGGSCVYVH